MVHMCIEIIVWKNIYSYTIYYKIQAEAEWLYMWVEVQNGINSSFDKPSSPDFFCKSVSVCVPIYLFVYMHPHEQNC